MKKIFENAMLGNLNLKNHLIRSATWENIAKIDGSIDEKTYKIYSELADGGVGARTAWAAPGSRRLSGTAKQPGRWFSLSGFRPPPPGWWSGGPGVSPRIPPRHRSSSGRWRYRSFPSACFFVLFLSFTLPRFPRSLCLRIPHIPAGYP